MKSVLIGNNSFLMVCFPGGIRGPVLLGELVGSYMFFLKIFSVCGPSLYWGFGYFS